MVIDSHAHYNNNSYRKPFRYLTRNDGGYALYLALAVHEETTKG